MALNIRTMPALKLKQLSNQRGGSCTVMFASSPDSDKIVLLEGFPKQIGTTFSKLFSAHFPPINKIKLSDLTRPRANEVLIVGGCVNAHKAILTWMISCCTGHGIQDFPIFETKKFTKYYLVREAAEILDIQYVVDLMMERMNVIAAVQVHSEDIRSLYTILGREHALVKEIVKKTACLMAKGPKAIKAYNVYTTLAQELKAFGEDIAPVMNAGRVELDEQRCKDRLQEKKDRRHLAWNEQKKAAYAARTQSVHRHGLSPFPPKHNQNRQASVKATPTMHKSVRAEKRGNGRLLLPLADIGVGVGKNYLRPMPYVSLRQSVEDAKVGSEEEVADPAVSEKKGENVDTSEPSTDVENTAGSSDASTLVGHALDSTEEQVRDEFKRAAIACKAELKKEQLLLIRYRAAHS